LWIGTGGGLDKLDRETGKFIHYLHNEYWINSIHEDKTGILWMGTNNGVVEFDQTAGSFTQYRHDPKDPRSLSSNNVSSICGDEEGGLWIGTYDRGLNAFDTRSRKVTHYVHDEKDPGSLNSNFIAAVYRERSGTLWILSANQGVNKLNRPKPLFTKYPYEAQAPLGFLRGVFEGTDGKIWIRKSKGWEKFDPKTETFVRMPLDQDLYPFAEDREGNLWIGPRSGGLCKRDQHGHLTSFHDSSGREFRQLVNCFSEGQGGRFWIGTLDGDVFAVDPAAHTVTLVQQGNIQVNAIREDRFGLVWVGTWEGLLCYDRMRDTVVRYTSDPRNLSSLGSSTILSIYEDRAGTMWFGAGGLNRYDRATGTFTRFAEKDGLSHYAVFEILEDDHGNLWLSTLKGLSKFCAACASLPAGRHGASGGDLKNNRFKNYDAYGGDGFRASNGEMFLGSSKGLTRFHPDSIRDNPFVPPIVLTTFRKFEQPFPFGKEIRLPYTENFISFEFAALSYVSPERNQYAYKMEGIDANWVNSGTRRYAGYPHLDPGEYVFRVKGSNNDGVWNEEGTSIAVIITPPFWATLWFRGFVFIAVLVSVGGSIRYVEMRKLKRRIERLEQERAVERERARISQDMHDEVGAGLTEIGILSELAKKYIQNPGQAEIHMQRVSQTS
jgi:streptogramin lyase